MTCKVHELVNVSDISPPIMILPSLAYHINLMPVVHMWTAGAEATGTMLQSELFPTQTTASSENKVFQSLRYSRTECNTATGVTGTPNGTQVCVPNGALTFLRPLLISADNSRLGRLRSHVIRAATSIGRYWRPRGWGH